MSEFKDFMSKTKVQANLLADITAKKSKELYDTSKNNVKIFDLTSQIEAIYKEIGKLIYESYDGVDVSQNIIDFKIADIKRKKDEIELLKLRNETKKTSNTCKNCNQVFDKKEKCCPTCGLTI